MKDSRQNMADLIGALAEDVEEIKKMLKDSSNTDEAIQGLTASLEPVKRFFSGGAPENISEIFGSGESVENFKRSLGDEMIESLQAYNDAIEKDMRDQGIPSDRELLYKIMDTQTDLVNGLRPAPDEIRQGRGFWRAIRPDRVMNAARRLWSKVPDGWYKSPYAWAGIGCVLLFLASYVISCVQWHNYMEETMRLRPVENKHYVTTIMIDELCPGLTVTLGAYEKLVDAVGVDSTLAIFSQQVRIMREKESQAEQR